MKMILYDRCLRCGRKLKKEEYRKIGYGKICLEKKMSNTQKMLFPLDKEQENATK
jgi:hypothetical protein